MTRSFPTHDFTEFHTRELPGRLAAGQGRPAFTATRGLGAIAFRTPRGEAFTYVPTDGDIEIRPGDADAAVVVEIEPDDFSALANDLASGPGLLFPGRIRLLRGESGRFLAWECGWRALYHGTPVFDPDLVDLRDRSGRPLDTGRSFALDDDRDEMAHFLAEAGFLHVRSVFDADEVARFRAGAAAARAAAVEGDGNSWWGVTAAGEKVLTRVLDATFRPELRGLEADPRLTSLIGLSPAELEPDMDTGEAVNVLFKHPDLVEGLGNLPWHRDCGMGGHALRCPTINLSIFLTPLDPERGGLWMLPGSAPYAISMGRYADHDPDGAVAVEAGAGDVTLHYGDTLHAAHAPTSRGEMRESLIVTWRPPDSDPHDGQAHYNDALKADDGVPIAGRA